MKKTTQKHHAVPYTTIATLWNQGKTYEEIAKATHRLQPKKDDPTKSVRAIVSRMLTDGYKNQAGKTVKLPRRKGTRKFTGVK